jgi:hypothetical protein
LEIQPKNPLTTSGSKKPQIVSCKPEGREDFLKKIIIVRCKILEEKWEE